MTPPVPIPSPPATGLQVMSSHDMADLCSKRHDHVLRDIRQMLMQLYGDEKIDAGLPERDRMEVFFDRMGWGIGSPDLGNGRVPGVQVGRDARGFIAEIRLDYSHTMTLIAGYKVKLRKAIIDKWQELERNAGAVTLPDLSDPAVLRGLLAGYAEDKTALLAKIEEQAPKLAALEALAEAEGSLCITDAAKALQVQPKALFSFLRREAWIYRRAGGSNDVGYQSKVQAGYIEHKVTRLRRSDGPDRMVEQVRITPKGLTRLGAMLEGGGRAKFFASRG